ncbi:MAG: hypothetical protein NTZ32_11825 [Planctomycetales bacterium]|nr:hypothetical protein [Planctomycetales bacterium]
MVDKFRAARLERMHNRCLEAAEKFPQFCHVALRSDVSEVWGVLSECYPDEFPSRLFELPETNPFSEHLDVLAAHWLLGAKAYRSDLYDKVRKSCNILSRWHEGTLKGIVAEYSVFTRDNLPPLKWVLNGAWDDFHRQHNKAIFRWLIDSTLLYCWRIGAANSRSGWYRLQFGDPLREWYGAFVGLGSSESIDDPILHFREVAKELVHERPSRPALQNHDGSIAEHLNYVAFTKQWLQVLYDTFLPEEIEFGFVKGTTLPWNVFSASARAIEALLASQSASRGSVAQLGEVAEAHTVKPIEASDNTSKPNQDGAYDDYFFWLWHSGRETPLPFARVRDISPTEAEWLHDFLWQKADIYSLVDMSKEDSLNAHNLNAVEVIDGCRVVGKGEAEVHRTSLRECIADQQMSHWLDLCDAWPKGQWDKLPSDWQGEDIYKWVDELHDWSEQAVVELKQARLHTGVLNRLEPLSDGLKAVSEPSEPPPIPDAIQHPLNESHTPKRASLHEQKLTKALSHIREKGPICGASVASYIDVEEGTFRRHYVPDLKERGVKNDGAGGGGYYLPSRST